MGRGQPSWAVQQVLRQWAQKLPPGPSRGLCMVCDSVMLGLARSLRCLGTTRNTAGGRVRPLGVLQSPGPSAVSAAARAQLSGPLTPPPRAEGRAPWDICGCPHLRPAASVFVAHVTHADPGGPSHRGVLWSLEMLCTHRPFHPPRSQGGHLSGCEGSSPHQAPLSPMPGSAHIPAGSAVGPHFHGHEEAPLPGGQLLSDPTMWATVIKAMSLVLCKDLSGCLWRSHLSEVELRVPPNSHVALAGSRRHKAELHPPKGPGHKGQCAIQSGTGLGLPWTPSRGPSVQASELGWRTAFNRFTEMVTYHMIHPLEFSSFSSICRLVLPSSVKFRVPSSATESPLPAPHPARATGHWPSHTAGILGPPGCGTRQTSSSS